jgi:hypothetical protein
LVASHVNRLALPFADGVACSACQLELEALNGDLTQALHHLIDHKMHVRNVLEQLTGQASGVLAAVSAMETPC